MKEDIKNKVIQLKNSFTVEGSPLIRSDRFTADEISDMKKEAVAGGTHPSQFSHLSKVWSDEEIANQIEVFLNQNFVSEADFQKKVDELYNKLPYENYDKELAYFKKELYTFLGRTEDKDIDPNFWAKFGSAPFFIDVKDTQRKTTILKKKYGACGMDEIFGNAFRDGYHLIHCISSALYSFKSTWDEEKRKKNLKMTVFTSPFNTLDELEENVVVKKVAEEAKKFYMDSTKPIKERVKAFSAHGEKETWIFHPSDRNLNKIFDIYYEQCELNRNETVDTTSIVEWWIDSLAYKRCEISYDKNPYHPDLIYKERNYTPSKAAIQRLNKYYMEKLFLEGVAEFDFDW